MGHASYAASYLKPFAKWLEDPSIVELAINEDGKLWIERAGDAHMVCVEGETVATQKAKDLAQAIVGEAGAKLSKSKPLVSGKIEYEDRPLRIQVAMTPAVEKGASVTIRLFSKGGIPDYKAEYLFGEAVSLDAKRKEKMASIRQLAEEDLNAALQSLVSMRLNILVSGGTSTGKTTFSRYLLKSVQEDERLITIEDALELFPHHPNKVCLLSERDPVSPRTTDALLQSALRMRPDRIIVGELRGRESLTYLEAINTGHGGSISTIHAETAKLAVDRLAIMVLQAGTPLTFAEVKDYIARSIDVIVQLGRAGGKRGITELYFPVDDLTNV
ncbi:P-type DNA transfer ATPase VirB11 (plasmid) [Phaeobacter piscinae]|uniref:Type IV secretion system protein n=1 Tax=Phaeobacter piscinae TaxID=1580596 RepID=A0ABM6PKY3_9RHOB|nr:MULTISPECIES: P-type DNA transfer ATPase VirB11 [Phaeobacter]ATG38093.1 P-type DNA transfer ATPase VirB11 [Phaeobacter piscinae]AUQ88614.1 P-type DNA transfer ATPase VirB11 [Phaeobacter piscinae]AUQ92603.1 P-type DNA transfer ATPase VirB11 [Phaeobacter inhibens]AUR26419.1 P-type DNA transfer ATPase VirB11 [Phaeobacter piscinae]